VILAVKHDAFKELNLAKLIAHSTVGELYLFDVKAFYDFEAAKKVCKVYWRL
jgi:hypothetical protein